MASRAPVVIARVHRWVALRRWRLAIAHTRLGLRFLKWHRSIVATRSWLFAARVLRTYIRSFRRLYHKQLHPRKAVIIQAAARAMQPRRAFHAHLAIVHAERLARERAARETAAATRLQAAHRGLVQRMAYRDAMGKKARQARELPAAVAIQAGMRGMAGRKAYARAVWEVLQVKTPSAVSLQRWWRVVTSEKVLRKLRSVVDRATAEHRKLIDELLAIKRGVEEAEAGLNSSGEWNAANGSRGAPGGKRFEMWISLRVGLPEEKPSPPSFPGTQVFAVRSMALKRSGTHFRAFFSDPANVDTNRDAEGHYLVERSWKHFGTILEYMRDGSCALPSAYVPSTYDNRTASSEEDELLEFVREAGYYGISELFTRGTSRLLQLRYGQNERMLTLLGAKGLL